MPVSFNDPSRVPVSNKGKYDMFSRNVSAYYLREAMNYSVIEMSVKEFLNSWLPDIDCLPIHQRIDVFNYGTENAKRKFPSKRQAIIGSVFKGIDISEIKINQRTAKERQKFSEKYESIDGGNRKRALRDFFRNKFTVNGYHNQEIGTKFFRDLTDEEKEIFFNFRMRLVVYKELTPVQKATIWETTNNSTPVNHQEKLNGMGDTPAANLVRQLARSIRSLGTSCHPLFEIKYSNDGKIIGECLTFDPVRLTYDRLVARVVTMIHQGEQPGVCDDNTIEDLYYDEGIDQEKAKVFEKKARECLDFIKAMAEEKKSLRKSKLTEDEFIILMRLYFTYKSRWKKFEIKDYSEWFDRFNTAFSQFHKKNPSAYGAEMIRTYDKNSVEKKMRCVMFMDNLRKGDLRRWEDSVAWIEKHYLTPDELIEYGIVVVRDTRRSFSRKDREMQLAKQRGKCYIDSKPLSMDDAEAAHIVSYADGGKTDPQNMVMIRSVHNRNMGTMNVNDYKIMWMNNREAA
jgi:hypothetical protein